MAVLFGSPTWRTRILRAAVLAGVAAAASLWWVLAVDAIPSTVRPYVGGSKNNTELNLLIGYNGLGRVDGDGQLASGGRLGGVGGAGVSSAAARQAAVAQRRRRITIGWLLPVAVGATALSVDLPSDAIVSPPSCSGAPGLARDRVQRGGHNKCAAISSLRSGRSSAGTAAGARIIQVSDRHRSFAVAGQRRCDDRRATSDHEPRSSFHVGTAGMEVVVAGLVLCDCSSKMGGGRACRCS
jgi:hypothetical protein